MFYNFCLTVDKDLIIIINNNNNNNNNDNNNNNAYISILPIFREAYGEHIYLSKKTGISPVKLVRN